MSEYILVFFLAIGALVAMTVYVQRALQARIRDGNRYMVQQAAKAHNAAIALEYEPYYANISSYTDRNQREDSYLVGRAGSTGIFQKVVNSEIKSQAATDQAAPKDAK